MLKDRNEKYAFSARSALYIITFTLVILSPIILNLIVDIVHLSGGGIEFTDAAMKVNTPEKLEIMIASYHSTIEMYRNSLYAVFGLFALFGISSAVISWTGSNKLSEMQRDLDTAREALKDARELKEKYQSYVADIESKLEQVGRIEASVSSIDTNIKNELNDAKDIIALAKAETERIRNLKFTAEKDRDEIAGTAKRFRALLDKVQALPDRADRVREEMLESSEYGVNHKLADQDELDEEIETYLKDLTRLEYAEEEEIENAIEAAQNERNFNKLFFDAIGARDNGDIEKLEESTQDIADMCAHNPDNLRWQQHLGILYGFSGELLLERQFFARALDAFDKCKNTVEKLVEVDSETSDWKRELAVSYYRLAQVEMLRENYKEGEQYSAMSIKILDELYKKKPFDAFITSRLVRAYITRVELLLAVENYSEVMDDLNTAKRLIENLRERDTENIYYQNEHARTLYCLVKYYKTSKYVGDDEVLRYAKRGYELFENLQKRNLHLDFDNTEKMEYLKRIVED